MLVLDYLLDDWCVSGFVMLGLVSSVKGHYALPVNTARIYGPYLRVVRTGHPYIRAVSTVYTVRTYGPYIRVHF